MVITEYVFLVGNTKVSNLQQTSIESSPIYTTLFIPQQRSWSEDRGSGAHPQPGRECRTTNEVSKSIAYIVLLLSLSVDLAGKAHTNAAGNVANTLAPDVLVDGGIDHNLLSVHGLLGELADSVHGTGSLSLEGARCN